MTEHIAFIGFGEAGQTISRGLVAEKAKPATLDTAEHTSTTSHMRWSVTPMPLRRATLTRAITSPPSNSDKVQ